jgi:ferredoxin
MPDPDPIREDDLAPPCPPAFHVTKACIACSICVAIAPDRFGHSSVAVRSAVIAQPTDDASLARCREAADNCPVEAIGTALPVR